MSEHHGFRDPMAWIAIGASAIVLVTGTILTVALGPSGAPIGSERPETPGSPTPTIPSPESPSPESPTPESPSPEPEGSEEPIAITFTDATNSAPPVNRSGGGQDTYSASNAADADDATAWCVEGDGIGELIAVGFDRTIGVTEVGLIPGYDKIDPQTGDDRFAENRKIRRVRFHFDDGRTHERSFEPPTRELTWTRLPGPTSTRTVVIEILDTTRPSQANRNYTCISTIGVLGIG